MKRTLAFVIAWAMLCACACAEGATAYSPTTGLPTDQPYAAMVVQLENGEDARPLVGLAQADVIYEVLATRDGATRYTAVFGDFCPETVASIAPADAIGIDLYGEWGGGFVYAGARGDLTYLQEANIFARYDALQADKGFRRDITRKAPHNIACSLSDLQAAMAAGVPESSPFRFSADSPTLKGREIAVFRVPYSIEGGYYPSYEYMAAEGKYYRFYNRSEHYDAQGVQLAYENVVVMYMAHVWGDGEDAQPLIATLGHNRCEYFIGGKYFVGTWQQEEFAGNTTYYDEEGAQVVFTPGKTFVQIVPEDFVLELVR